MRLFYPGFDRRQVPTPDFQGGVVVYSTLLNGEEDAFDSLINCKCSTMR